MNGNFDIKRVASAHRVPKWLSATKDPSMTFLTSDLIRNLGLGFLAGTIMVGLSNAELVTAVAAIVA